MLEKGISYPGKFWIDIESLKELFFYGNGELKEDNFFYIETELPRSHYLIHNYLIEDNVFKVCGEINGQKITIPAMWRKKITDMHAILKSNCIYSGDTFVNSNEKLKKVSAKISGFKTLLDDEFQNKEFKLNEDIISFSQEYSARKDNITTITIDFNISKNLDEVIDLLDTVNSFFVLINNVPSEIKEILVLNDSNVQYEVNENWLPIETLNQKQPSYTEKLGLKNLNEYLEKWINFSEGCQIACEQYFALVSLNKKYYSQLTLSLSLFAFEGFLNRYIELVSENQKTNKCDRYISRSQHDVFCKEILFPEIDLLVKEKFGEVTLYADSIKQSLTYAFETSFRKRLVDFFDKNNDLLKSDLEGIEESKESFIEKILSFRNTYAHNSDSKIEEVKAIKNTFSFYKVVNKAIRILILKDYLKIDDIRFDN